MPLKVVMSNFKSFKKCTPNCLQFFNMAGDKGWFKFGTLTAKLLSIRLFHIDSTKRLWVHSRVRSFLNLHYRDKERASLIFFSYFKTLKEKLKRIISPSLATPKRTSFTYFLDKIQSAINASSAKALVNSGNGHFSVLHIRKMSIIKRDWLSYRWLRNNFASWPAFW